ncbi:hypothetical protein [Amycolatopsis thermoflava]|uniref:hypothetical protein n=1 Tax=Amycolatopsis thermoflava TaxID=84480 RepID=UPI003EB8A090
MQLQTVNEHARERYHDFENAINTVRMAVDELTALSRKLSDRKDGGRFEGWQVPTKDEITKAIRTASDDLDTLRAESVKYKAELVSRTWRV